MRFSANVSILFKKVPFQERFDRAREADFSAVVFWWRRRMNALVGHEVPGMDRDDDGAVSELGL